jgi:glucose-1-phosphate thymidylyltransferase
MRKGIVLAGGSGTRLFPATLGISKQLLPIYDKPMIYYPLSVLMIAGINDILIITTPDDVSQYRRVLGDGTQFGIQITYALQRSPDGLAQALIIGEEFISGNSVAMVLGDNIFYGQGFREILRRADARSSGATIFGFQVNNPDQFGVLELDNKFRPVSIEEKPVNPKSRFAVTGLYFYDNRACAIARDVKPSMRGELEITSVNQAYLDIGALEAELLGRGFAWLDTGTHGDLLEAAHFVATIEKRQGYKIACLEEIGWRNGWLSSNELRAAGDRLQKTGYGKYLIDLAYEGASE